MEVVGKNFFWGRKFFLISTNHHYHIKLPKENTKNWLIDKKEETKYIFDEMGKWPLFVSIFAKYISVTGYLLCFKKKTNKKQSILRWVNTMSGIWQSTMWNNNKKITCCCPKDQQQTNWIQFSISSIFLMDSTQAEK